MDIKPGSQEKENGDPTGGNGYGKGKDKSGAKGKGGHKGGKHPFPSQDYEGPIVKMHPQMGVCEMKCEREITFAVSGSRFAQMYNIVINDKAGNSEKVNNGPVDECAKTPSFSTPNRGSRKTV